MYKRKKDKLAIVGYAPNRVETPFEDESFDIAFMNDIHLVENWPLSQRHRLRFDVLFDMHDPEVMRSFSRAKMAHWHFLTQTEAPVITLEVIPEIPASESYPLDKIVKKYDSKYFTNTVSYQLAWALHMGYKEVHIYGVNFIGREEYEYQRASAEYWIGYLRGKGVTVYVPETSCLLKSSFLYGYETHVLNKTVAQNLSDTIREKQGEVQRSHKEKMNEIMKNEGQLDALNWMSDVYGHVARGGFVPPPASLQPETAFTQQKKDRKVQAMDHFKSIVGKALSSPENMETALRLEAAAAVLLGLEDDYEQIKRIDEG